MFKNIIAPVQAWLLANGQCVGCGMPIKQGTKGKSKKGEPTVVCKCGRTYIFDETKKTYRRALISEL